MPVYLDGKLLPTEMKKHAIFLFLMVCVCVGGCGRLLTKGKKTVKCLTRCFIDVSQTVSLRTCSDPSLL